MDPRVIYLEDGAALAGKVNFSVIVAFRRDLAKIRLINGTSSAEMITADVSGAVNGWCRVHGSDPDCVVPGPGLTFLVIAAVIIVLLAVASWYFLKKKGATGQKPPGP